MVNPTNGRSHKPGKQLKRLIAALESLLAGSGASIEAPSRRLLDRDTGEPREHDVLISWDHGHHQILTAIECRDRSRPVGVPDVEAFADKCASTGVHSAVIVSATGFRRTAERKAKSRAVTLMHLKKVHEYDWKGEVRFVGYTRQFNMMYCRPVLLHGSPRAIVGVYNPSGRRITDDEIMQVVMDGVSHAELKQKDVGVVWKASFTIVTPDCGARDLSGKMWTLSHIVVETEFTTIRTESPSTKYEYIGGGMRYSVATADVTSGAGGGKIVMVRKEDGSATVGCVPIDEN